MLIYKQNIWRCFIIKQDLPINEKIRAKEVNLIDENGVERGTEQGLAVLKQLVGDGNFLNSEPLESLLYTYTFAGNHDKCRALEGFAMDMGIVYSDLTDPANFDYRRRAYKVLHGMGYATFLQIGRLKLTTMTE